MLRIRKQSTKSHSAVIPLEPWTLNLNLPHRDRWQHADDSHPCPVATSPDPWREIIDRLLIPQCSTEEVEMFSIWKRKKERERRRDRVLPLAMPAHHGWVPVDAPLQAHHVQWRQHCSVCAPCTQDSCARRRCKRDGGTDARCHRWTCSSRPPVRQSSARWQRSVRQPCWPDVVETRLPPQGACPAWVPARPVRTAKKGSRD